MVGLFSKLGEVLYRREQHRKFLKTKEGKLYKASEDAPSLVGEECVAVVISNGDVYAFGPFVSVEAADRWEAAHRVAMKQMFSGQASFSSGGQAILPAGSEQALEYVKSSGGLIDPSDKDWQVIAG